MGGNVQRGSQKLRSANCRIGNWELGMLKNKSWHREREGLGFKRWQEVGDRVDGRVEFGWRSESERLQLKLVSFKMIGRARYSVG